MKKATVILKLDDKIREFKIPMKFYKLIDWSIGLNDKNFYKYEYINDIIHGWYYTTCREKFNVQNIQIESVSCANNLLEVNFSTDSNE